MNNELSITTFDISKPEQSLKVAELLQKFVKEKGLTSNIQGKQYPHVEAWQFAGSQLGLVPIIKEVTCLSSANPISGDTETKYCATVEIERISDGKIISRGFALCSNKEYSKRKFDEYAVASMAQTRAVGKAFRNCLSWLMKAAGFEATPAEEMDFKQIEDIPTEDERKILRDLVFNSTLDDSKKEEALALIEGCGNYKLYEKIQHRLESVQIPIDQIPNPNQKDITNHLRKTVVA